MIRCINLCRITLLCWFCDACDGGSNTSATCSGTVKSSKPSCSEPKHVITLFKYSTGTPAMLRNSLLSSTSCVATKYFSVSDPAYRRIDTVFQIQLQRVQLRWKYASNSRNNCANFSDG